jgi:hypothetical protein
MGITLDTDAGAMGRVSNQFFEHDHPALLLSSAKFGQSPPQTQAD